MKTKRNIMVCFGMALFLMIMAIGTVSADTTAASDSPDEVAPDFAAVSHANVGPTEKVIIGFKDRPDISLVHAHGGKATHQYTIINAVAAELPEQAIAALQKNPKVAYIEPDYEVHILQETLPWGVDRVDADVVHNYPNKGTGIKVAIIDTGIDYNHPDLNDTYFAGDGLVLGQKVDPMDDNGHGTHCAGIVAAEDNTEGVIGVAPEAQLYAFKAFNSGGGAYTSDIVAGIEWAADNQVDVISMSFGSDTSSSAMEAALNEAYDVHGILLVAAAGNDGNPAGRGDSVDYPARYDSVIAVAATDTNDKRASWSSTGPAVELAAPGVNIYSTLWDDTYGYKSGTSMACPHVAGVAALVFNSPMTTDYDFNRDGSWDANEVRMKLQNTAEDLGRVSWYGYGLVDAENAVDQQPQEPIHDVAVTAISAPSSVIVGDMVNVDVTVTNTGNYVETFDVKLVSDNATPLVTADDFVIGNETVSNLAAGGSEDLVYIWDTTGSSLGDHNLTATAELVDDDPTNNFKTTVVEITEEATVPTMHIAKIAMSTDKKGVNVWALANVTVVDDTGAAVEGATVYGKWSGLTSDTDTGTTGSDGTVILKSNTIKKPEGTFTFTVTAVVLEGWTYEPSENIETSDSVDYP